MAVVLVVRKKTHICPQCLFWGEKFLFYFYFFGNVATELMHFFPFIKQKCMYSFSKIVSATVTPWWLFLS